VLQAALGAAFISLLRLILATLPADPTPAPAITLDQTENGTWADTPKAEPDLGALVRDHQERTFP